MGLPNNIKSVRTKRGFSQAKLASLVQPPTDQSTINRLEKGQISLTTDWMEKLSVPLNVESYQLMQESFDIDNLQLLPPEIRRSIPESKVVGEKMPLYATIRRGVGKVDIDAGISRPIERPYYLNGVKGAFGIRIVEKFLHKLDLNEIACIDPTYLALPGSIVAVIYADGTADVLKLAGETATEWVFLKELPKEQKISVRKDSVRDVLRVRGQEYSS